MIVILNNRDRAVAQSRDICKTCRYYHEVTYAQNTSIERRCMVAQAGIITLKGAVSECRDHMNRSHPYLSDMQQIAWTIERRGDTGFKAHKPEVKP